MKKVLLGTTALVAAGLFAGDARAEFDVTVNGSWNTAFGFVDEDDGFIGDVDFNGDGVIDPLLGEAAVGESGYQRHNSAINQDWEVHFRAIQTLDNGIAVGGRVELEGRTEDDQIDERWMFFRGGFGELRVGDEDDARKLKSYTAPDPTGFIFGVNSPTFTFNNGAPGQFSSTNTTVPNLENDSAKLIYFTPSFGGFQLAVSYAPDGNQDRGGAGTASTSDGSISNAISVGADYSGEFGGFTIGAGGGYSMGNDNDDDADPTVWAVGLNLGFAGFTVGGSVAFADADVDDGESTVYDVGVTYTLDAVTVGLGWSHGEYDDGGDGGDELDHYQLGLGYALGPGVTLAAMVGMFDYEDGGAADNDNSGWQAGLGAGLNF
jgi:outer membrane protein OmpU